MSRLNDLLRELRTREPALARDLEREVAALADRRAFGLNFERHVPEAVELPGRKVRKGDKVRILPPRGQMPKKSDEKLWRVVGIDRSARTAKLEPLAAPAPDSGEPVVEAREARHETRTAALDDLVVVAEFRDPIYPGLVSTGKVERGGDKPFHTVINAENFHALQTLLFTHRGKVDCIYIDPPYNTGAKDWKYNNDYVEGDDLYRHSKWLAFMERRLLLAKELLNPDDSVLIVTIDEKEYLRLGLLLEQTFPEARIQMVIVSHQPARDVHATSEFSRVDEYLFFVMRRRLPSLSRLDDDMLRVEVDEAERQRRRLCGAIVAAELMHERRDAARSSVLPDLCRPRDAARFVEIGEPLCQRRRPREVVRPRRGRDRRLADSRRRHREAAGSYRADTAREIARAKGTARSVGSRRSTRQWSHLHI